MTTEPTFVLLRRDELFQFLGQYALPPWNNAGGEPLGAGIDCAPIAQELEAWMNEHQVHYAGREQEAIALVETGISAFRQTCEYVNSRPTNPLLPHLPGWSHFDWVERATAYISGLQAEPLAEQVDRLARFIMERVPGEPSQSQGAIDTAIRVIASLLEDCPDDPDGLHHVGCGCEL